MKMTKRRKPKLKSKAERTLREILGDPKLAVSAGLLLGMALAVTHGLIDPSKPALPGDCSGCIGPYGIPCPPDCPNFGNHFDGCHKRDCLKQCEGSKK